MSRPSTRGTGDASSPREVRPTDDHERPKRPTRNAPRILHSGTILYSNNFRALSQAREQDDGEIEDVQGTAREAPQTPTSTIHNSPQRKTRKTKTMRFSNTDIGCGTDSIATPAGKDRSDERTAR